MTQSETFATHIERHIPFLRRYARALCGSQNAGDAIAVEALEKAIEQSGNLTESPDIKIALFRAFHEIWSAKSVDAENGDEEDHLHVRAQKNMAQLTGNSREALLLHAIEEFSYNEIAQILDVDRDRTMELVETARQEMKDVVAGRILIIEDEAIIAMDLQSIVTEMGHSLTGIGRTRDHAVKLAKAETPALVMADIQLADNSSGIDAVGDILQIVGDVPVIFITAFPERLLTGKKPEPAFLIAKPYTEEQVRSAVSQAMFFSSTETLIKQ
ncbi:response regulator [Aestuariibius insulae]|uniref:response regulator n=1 Tax=Aestuariibius insulae TaxID=2058287 RepID=UPI00345EB286